MQHPHPGEWVWEEAPELAVPSEFVAKVENSFCIRPLPHFGQAGS